MKGQLVLAVCLLGKSLLWGGAVESDLWEEEGPFDPKESGTLKSHRE